MWIVQIVHFPLRRQVFLNHSNHTIVAANVSELAVHIVKAGEQDSGDGQFGPSTSATK